MGEKGQVGHDGDKQQSSTRAARTGGEERNRGAAQWQYKGAVVMVWGRRSEGTCRTPSPACQRKHSIMV